MDWIDWSYAIKLLSTPIDHIGRLSPWQSIPNPGHLRCYSIHLVLVVLFFFFLPSFTALERSPKLGFHIVRCEIIQAWSFASWVKALSGWISSMIHWIIFLALHGILRSLLQDQYSKAWILFLSCFKVQRSLLHSLTGNSRACRILTFVGTDQVAYP